MVSNSAVLIMRNILSREQIVESHPNLEKRTDLCTTSIMAAAFEYGPVI